MGKCKDIRAIKSRIKNKAFIVQNARTNVMEVL